MTCNPLAEIGQAVQDRAKHLDLDVSSIVGEDALRRLVSEEVHTWVSEHRRGLRPAALPDPADAAERIFRDLARFGPLTELLADDDVWEVVVRPSALVG